MVQIKFGKRHIPFPTGWNDLTKKQLLAVAPVLFQKDIFLSDKIFLLKVLSGISWYRWAFITSETILENLDRIEFLLQSVELTKNRLPKFRGLGPADDFVNMRGKEAAYSDSFFGSISNDTDFTSKEDIQHLNNLVAVLYRPSKTFYNASKNRDGDARVPFNPNSLPYYTSKASRWPLNHKILVYLWYRGCQSAMVTSNPKVFTSGGEPAMYGLWSVMRSVAMNGAHGDFSRVEGMYYPELLMELNESISEAEKLNKK